jgi:peroxiredoxin
MTTPHALGPGDPAPEFTLPAVTGDGNVSLAQYRGKSAVLLGLFRGLHCPFCRRQIFQLSGMHDTLAGMDITTVAVVNTPRPRAELYFRYHPVRVVLLADPDARTHQAFGVSSVVPDESFAAARINPTGELPAPMHPMKAGAALNAKDGFVLTQVDEEVFNAHGTQLGGHFLIDRDGIVRWTILEGQHGVADLARFPAPAEILTAARSLGR